MDTRTHSSTIDTITAASAGQVGMKIAINRLVKNKARPGTDDFKLLATEFENVTLTLTEIAAAIAAGFSWCAQHVDRRKAANFVCTDVLGVDLDEGWTFDSLLAHELVADHGLLIYETHSSTLERPRLRAMFRSPYTIIDADEMRKVVRGLVRMFGADESCVDPCRMYYGNEGCDPYLIDKTLTVEQIEYLKELGATQGDDDEQDGGNRNANNFVRSSLHVADDQLLRTRDGKHAPLSILASGTPVHCPHHADRNGSKKCARPMCVTLNRSLRKNTRP
ncbi:hypothetical protein [Burkholderia mayonis]|uniref:hypothetical protein n=1 Tax=Burkholderia mayonis TaxID=1385591 RepID=UPI000AF53B86|nr:hypothetical protein [Burkholderia mayonis]